MFWRRREVLKKNNSFKPRIENLEERLEMSADVADLLGFTVDQKSDVYIQAVGGSAGANTDFGIGVSQQDAQYLIRGLPNIPSTRDSVYAGTFDAGETIHFAMLTHWQGKDYFASTADVNSSAAKEVFTDRVGAVPHVILERVNADTWRLHLDDAASHDDDDNDIVVEIKVVPKPPEVAQEPPVEEPPVSVVVDEEPEQSVQDVPTTPPVENNPPVVPPVVEEPESPPVENEPVAETPVDPPVSTPDPVTPPVEEPSGNEPHDHDKENAVVILPPQAPIPDPVVSVPDHVIENPHTPIQPAPVDDMVDFTMPFNGTLYVRFVSSEAGAINIFGTGTTSANFNPLLTVRENQASQVGFIKVADFAKGTVIPFAIDSKYNGSEHYAFSIGTDAVSREAFGDADNSLRLGKTILQKTGKNQWRLYLDDGWTGDDDDNDLVIDIKVVR